MSAAKVSDFSIDAIIDPNASPNIDTILWTAANNIETTDCELYLWFSSLNASTDPPQKIWTGNIVDFEKIDELACSLTMVDVSVRLDKYIGAKIDLAAYPSADPDDVGKMMNIIYGSPKKARCHAIKAGACDSIASDWTTTSPVSGGSFVLSDASEFPSSGAFTVQIDSEQVRVASRAGNTLTIATSGRAYAATSADAHDKGSAVFEVLSEYAYCAADHPVKNLSNCLVDDIAQTSDVTLYTGKSGDEHAGYPGKAIVAFDVKPTIKKQVNLNISNPAHLHSADQTSNTVTENATNSLVITEGCSTSANFGLGVDGYITFPPHSNITAGSYVIAWTITNLCPHLWNCQLQFGNTIVFNRSDGVVTINRGSPVTIAYNFNANSLPVYFQSFGEVFGTKNVGARLNITSASRTITYTTTPSVYESTQLSSLDGRSSADVVIGQSINVDIDGYKDDASGTYTGAPNALIERPDHIFRHFLYTYGGVATANFYTNAGTNFSAKGYRFSILINEYKRLKEWLSYMAFQCRCYFRFAAGQAQLLWRPDSLTSQKTITAAMLRMNEDFKTTTRIRRSHLDEVINKIAIHYDKDWSKSGDEAYSTISQASDATSITRYGEKEKPELFKFDFIVLSAMADDLRDFYIARYKDRKKLLEMELFLDNSELEFADAVTLAPLGNLLCEAQKSNVAPGSGRDDRIDAVKLVLKEY